MSRISQLLRPLSRKYKFAYHHTLLESRLLIWVILLGIGRAWVCAFGSCLIEPWLQNGDLVISCVWYSRIPTQNPKLRIRVPDITVILRYPGHPYRPSPRSRPDNTVKLYFASVILLLHKSLQPQFPCRCNLFFDILPIRFHTLLAGLLTFLIQNLHRIFRIDVTRTTPYRSGSH